MKRLSCLWLVSLVMAVNMGVTLSSQAADDPASNSPKKIALLVGINQYRWSNSTSFKKLRGSVNDVSTVKQLLQERFGFSAANIRTLTDHDATRTAILRNFMEFLYAQSQPGDIAVFYYSGHGSQVVDDDGDETDGLDETLVPYDGRNPSGDVQDICDDEIYRFLQKLSSKNVHTVVIFDSCHSGSAARGRSPIQARWIPEDKRPIRTTKHEAPSGPASDASSGFFASLPSYVALSASQANQNAYEVQIGKKFFGAFSLALIDSLQNLPASADYIQLMEAVNYRLNRLVPGQRAEVEGDFDFSVFGNTPSGSRPFVLATRIDKKRAKLSVGKMHGVTKGSVYRLLVQGDSNDMAGRTMGFATVTDVGTMDALAKMTKGQMDSSHADAIEEEHDFGDLRPKVLVDSDLALDKLEDRLRNWTTVEIVQRTGVYDVRLYEKNGSIISEHYDGTAFGPPVELDSDGALVTIKRRLRRYARYRALQMLENQKSSLRVTLEVLRCETDENKREVWRTVDEINKSRERVLRPGDEVRFEVSNTSPYGQAFHVYVLYIGADYRVTVIYPQGKGKDNLLKPGKSVRTKSGTVRGVGRRDVIKVIVTTEAIDVWSLQQPGVSRNKLKSHLERVLHDAFHGSRYFGDAAVPIADWQTQSVAMFTVEQRRE